MGVWLARVRRRPVAVFQSLFDVSVSSSRMNEKEVSLVATFPSDRVIVDLQAREKKAAIREILQSLVEFGALKDDGAKKAEKAILKRELVGSTAIGKGLAIPHAKDCSFVDGLVGIFARSKSGLPFDAHDGALVHVIFLVLSPANMAAQHLDLIKRVASLHKDEKTLRYLASDEKLKSLEAIFKEVDEQFS